MHTSPAKCTGDSLRNSSNASMAVVAVRAARLGVIVYASWLGMMAVHESGHVLHAWLSGGHVERVILPLWGFSRTDVFPNPSPTFVTWGGPIWGCVWPLMGWSALRAMRLKPWPAFRFFAGLCLIANGAYLGVGWAVKSGDARDLVMMGTPRALLILFGAVTVPAGLWIWHRLGSISASRS
jgi:hypothetical protein